MRHEDNYFKVGWRATTWMNNSPDWATTLPDLASQQKKKLPRCFTVPNTLVWLVVWLCTGLMPSKLLAVHPSASHAPPVTPPLEDLQSRWFVQLIRCCRNHVTNAIRRPCLMFKARALFWPRHTLLRWLRKDNSCVTLWPLDRATSHGTPPLMRLSRGLVTLGGRDLEHEPSIMLKYDCQIIIEIIVCSCAEAETRALNKQTCNSLLVFCRFFQSPYLVHIY